MIRGGFFRPIEPASPRKEKKAEVNSKGRPRYIYGKARRNASARRLKTRGRYITHVRRERKARENREERKLIQDVEGNTQETGSDINHLSRLGRISNHIWES